MDDKTKHWLWQQLGATTPLTDLQTRYTRLGTARAVALEVLGERLAALLAQPATVGVSGVVNVGYAENIKAYERQIALLESGKPSAPDETPTPDDDDTTVLEVIRLTARPRR